MSQFQLVCNLKECRKTLLKSAYVTTCFHVFCNEHGLNMFSEQELICSVCDTHLKTAQDITRVNLKPEEVSKSIMLAGLSPELIMDIATRAMCFWEYQVNEANICLEAHLKTANEKINTLDSEIESLHEELQIKETHCQVLVQKLQKKIKVINYLKQNSYKATKSTTRGIIKQEEHSGPKLSCPNPIFKTRAFNLFRVPEQLSTFHPQFSPKNETLSLMHHPFHGDNLDCDLELNFQPNLDSNVFNNQDFHFQPNLDF